MGYIAKKSGRILDHQRPFLSMEFNPPHFAARETETHGQPLKGCGEASGFLGQEETSCLSQGVWFCGCMTLRGLCNPILAPLPTDHVALGQPLSFLFFTCKTGTRAAPALKAL